MKRFWLVRLLCPLKNCEEWAPEENWHHILQDKGSLWQSYCQMQKKKKTFVYIYQTDKGFFHEIKILLISNKVTWHNLDETDMGKAFVGKSRYTHSSKKKDGNIYFRKNYGNVHGEARNSWKQVSGIIQTGEVCLIWLHSR